MTDNSTLMSLGEADTTLALAMIFCLILLVIGVRENMFWILAGPVWIVCGLTIFINYGIIFELSSIGLGMGLFIMGAYNALQ